MKIKTQKSKVKIKARYLVFITIIIIFVLIIIMRLTTDNVKKSTVENGVQEATSPLQSGASKGGNAVSNFFYGMTHYDDAVSENEKLRKTISNLEMENDKLQSYKDENAELRKALNFQQDNTKFTTVTGKVIGRNIESWYDSVTINVGSKDGIKANMPVFSYDGLVGKITGVTKNTSEVTLISDPNFGGISGITKESRFPGIIKGNTDIPGRLEMINIPTEAPIQVGYEVVTSGLGGMLYDNIKVGVVKEIQNSDDGLNKTAVIDPSQNFNKLNILMVITGEKVIVQETTTPVTETVSQ